MSNEIEILMHLQKMQRVELDYRRRREFQIFTWSVTVLLAISGGILVGELDNKLLPVEAYSSRVVASIVIAMLTTFSSQWQIHHRNAAARHKKVLVDIATRLGAYEPDALLSPKPLYPEGFRGWGVKVQFRGRFAVTIGVGAIALLAVWLGPLSEVW